MITTLRIDSDLAPLESAIRELLAIAELDPDAVCAFTQELEGADDIERQLFRVNSEQRAAVGAGDIRVVFEPSERLAEFLAAARAPNVLK